MSSASTHKSWQTSSLDAHAQNKMFDTIHHIKASPSGNKTKTVIFITHRLSTARRADKIAMMEGGVRPSRPIPFRLLLDINGRVVDL